MVQKVLATLKPKTTSLGFTKEELEGVAQSIAANLTDETTEEQIASAVESVIPFLKVSQSVATRVINAAKKKETHPKETEDVDDDAKSKVSTKNEEPEWFKAYREQNDKKLSALIEGKTLETRKALFSKKLEGLTDQQKERKLKDFDRMSFADDDDFTSYLSEVEEAVKDEVQMNSNQELGNFGQPFRGRKTKAEISDDEISEVINQLNI